MIYILAFLVVIFWIAGTLELLARLGIWRD